MPNFASISLDRTGPSPFLSMVPMISVIASFSAACMFRYVKGGGTSRPLLKKVYVLVPGVHHRLENQGWSEPDGGSIAGCVIGTSEGCKKLQRRAISYLHRTAVARHLEARVVDRVKRHSRSSHNGWCIAASQIPFIVSALRVIVVALQWRR